MHVQVDQPRQHPLPLIETHHVDGQLDGGAGVVARTWVDAGDRAVVIDDDRHVVEHLERIGCRGVVAGPDDDQRRPGHAAVVAHEPLLAMC